MVALSASRLVCCAMVEMTLRTSPICMLDSPSCLTVSLAVLMTSRPRSAIDAASLVLREISVIAAPICSAPAATACTLVDTRSAALATAPAWALVSSDALEICIVLAESCSAAAATVCAEPSTFSMTSAI